jgi:hypothetical protein
MSYVYQKLVPLDILSNGPGFCHWWSTGSTPILLVKPAKAWTPRLKVVTVKSVVNMSTLVCNLEDKEF